MTTYSTFWRFYFVLLSFSIIGIGFRIYDGVASAHEIANSIVVFGTLGAIGLIATIVKKLNK